MKGVGGSEFSQVGRKKPVKLQAGLINSEACRDQAGDEIYSECLLSPCYTPGLIWELCMD